MFKKSITIPILLRSFTVCFNIQSKVNYLVWLIKFLNTIFILFVENTLHQQAGGSKPCCTVVSHSRFTDKPASVPDRSS